MYDCFHREEYESRHLSGVYGFSVILFNINMHLKKHISLSILFFTSLVCSRAMFAFFDDPERPNLLVVVAIAVVVFVLSLPVYRRYSSETQNSHKRLLFPVFVQVAVIIFFYLFLR